MILFIDLGVDVMAKDASGLTVWDYANESGNLEVAELLASLMSERIGRSGELLNASSPIVEKLDES